MRNIVILLVHLLVTLARLTRPGGVRSVIAESVLVKHQLLVLTRSRQRSPNLRVSDRIVAGLCALFIHPSRLIRSAIVLKPSTILRLHRALKDRKYRLLFSSKSRIQRQPLPKYLSTDNDLLYRFHQWQANLRILEVTEIKTVPYVPLSHPFVERLIGTIRRECLDRTLFWTAADLESKLLDFQHYYQGYRAHDGLGGRLPEPIGEEPALRINFASYGWRRHCHGLYQTPIAA